MWTRSQQVGDGLAFMAAGIMLLARVLVAAVCVAIEIIFLCSVRP